MTELDLKNETTTDGKQPVVRRAPTKKCWNCKHRTQAFKVGKLTHYHCMSPTYVKQHEEGVAISPWETLRVFSDSCDEYELRS